MLQKDTNGLKKFSTLLAGAALALQLCGCAPWPAGGYYATSTPYKAPGAADDHARLGLRTVFLTHLGRHGSRYLTSEKRLKKMLGALDDAEAAGALTARGARLREGVRALMRASDYENVTPLAAWQQKGIAGRLCDANPELFGPPWGGRKVHAVATFKKRTQDTLNAFLAELAVRTGADPEKDFSREVSTGCQPLRFFDCDENYLAHKKAADWLAAPGGGKLRADSLPAARGVLRRLAGEAWLDKLDGPGNDGKYFSSSLEMAVCLYEIAASETNLGRDVAGFRGYFSAWELEWFEYLSDYNDFYEMGPGRPGSAVTFGMAAELLRAFLSDVQRAIDAPAASPAAELRFAHAETLVPFAALLRLEGASEQRADLRFTAGRWKGAAVSPMSANIQWLLCRAPDGGYRVKILLNEKPARIAGLRGGPYYAWPELKRFYEDVLAALPR